MDRRKIAHPEGKDKSRQSPEYGDSTPQSPYDTFDKRRQKYFPYNETPLVPHPVSESPYLQPNPPAKHERAPEQEEIASEHEVIEPPPKKQRGPRSKATRKKVSELMKEQWEEDPERRDERAQQTSEQNTKQWEKKNKQRNILEARARRDAQRKAWKEGTLGQLGQSSDQQPPEPGTGA